MPRPSSFRPRGGAFAAYAPRRLDTRQQFQETLAGAAERQAARQQGEDRERQSIDRQLDSEQRQMERMAVSQQKARESAEKKAATETAKVQKAEAKQVEKVARVGEDTTIDHAKLGVDAAKEAVADVERRMTLKGRNLRAAATITNRAASRAKTDNALDAEDIRKQARAAQDEADEHTLQELEWEKGKQENERKIKAESDRIKGATTVLDKERDSGIKGAERTKLLQTGPQPVSPAVDKDTSNERIVNPYGMPKNLPPAPRTLADIRRGEEGGPVSTAPVSPAQNIVTPETGDIRTNFAHIKPPKSDAPQAEWDAYLQGKEYDPVADFQTRAQEFQAKAEAHNVRIQAINAPADKLRADLEAQIGQPAILPQPDGTNILNPALEPEDRQKLNAAIIEAERQSGELAEAQNALGQEHATLQAEAQEFERQRVAAEQAEDAAIDRTGQKFGMKPFTDRVKALTQTYRQVRDRVGKAAEGQAPGTGKAAMQAAHEQYQIHREAAMKEGGANRAEILKELQQTESYYQKRIKEIGLDDEQGSGKHEDLEVLAEGDKADVKSFAEKYGIPVEKAQGLRDDVAKLSRTWETPLGKDPDQSRVLSEGDIVVNPAHWIDPDAYEKAVKDSGGSPEAKEQAMAMLPSLRKDAATRLLNTIGKSPELAAVVNALPGTTDEEKALALVNQKKNSPVWSALEATWRRTQGSAVSTVPGGIMGMIATITGNRWATESMLAYQDEAGAYEALGDALAPDNVALNFLTKIPGAAESIVPALVGGAGAKIGSKLLNLGKTGTKIATAAGSALTAGGQSTAGTYGQAMDAILTRNGGDFDAARAEALVPAITSGIITAVATAVGGGGVESIFADATKRAAIKQTLWQAVRGMGVTVTREGAEEALEEGVDQLGQAINERLTFNPDKPIREIIKEVIEAGALGGVLGGAMGGAKARDDAKQEEGRKAIENAANLAESDEELRTVGEVDPLASTRAMVLRDIAQGTDITTLQNDQLAAIGLQRTDKGEIKPAKGKDALPPAVSVENGKPIILQPALDELEQQFPATRALVGMSETEARAKATAPPEKSPATFDAKKVGAQPADDKSIVRKPFGEFEGMPVEQVSTKEGKHRSIRFDHPTLKQGDSILHQGEEFHVTGVVETTVDGKTTRQIIARPGPENPRLTKLRSDIAADEAEAATPTKASAQNVLQGTSAWTAKTDKGTILTVPASEAKSAQEAELALAAQVPTGEVIDTASITAPVAASSKDTTAKTSTPKERVMAAAKPIVRGEKDTGKAAKIATRAKMLADAVEREAGKFTDIVLEPVPDSSGFAIRSDGSLALDVEQALKHLEGKSMADVRRWITRVIKEEFQHRVSIELERDNKEGFGDKLKAWYDSLPDDLKQQAAATYNAQTGGKTFRNDFEARHETFRQFLERKNLTEAALAPKARKDLRDLILAFVKALRAYYKTAAPQVRALLDELIATAEAKAAELQGLDGKDASIIPPAKTGQGKTEPKAPDKPGGVKQSKAVEDMTPEERRADEKRIQRKLMEASLETEDKDEPFRAAGYTSIGGIWVHPHVDPDFVRALKPETMKRLREGNITFIDPETESSGRAVLMSDGTRGIALKTDRKIGQALYTLKDEAALHELGHHVWRDDLTQEQRDAFKAGGIRTEHGREVASGKGRGAGYASSIAGGVNSVAEEDFAQHFAENDGDTKKTIAPAPTVDADLLREAGGDPKLAAAIQAKKDREAAGGTTGDWKAVRADEPPVPAGHVRFYHGGQKGTGNRWVAAARDYAEGYADKSSGAGVFFIDVPVGDPQLKQSFDTSGTPMSSPFSSFEARAELMANAKPLPYDPDRNKTVDAAANEAATDITEAQAEAENTKVGRVTLMGWDISIETPAGAKRQPEWPALKDHYGRILGTTGADSTPEKHQHLDAFVREGTPADWSGNVFVVNQKNKDGTHDETKTIFGVKDASQAKATYLRNYAKGWRGLGTVVEMTPEQFKQWTETGDMKKPATRPASPQANAKAEKFEALAAKTADPKLAASYLRKAAAIRAGGQGQDVGTSVAPEAESTVKDSLTPPAASAKPNLALPEPTLADIRDRNKLVGHHYAGPPGHVVIQLRGLDTEPLNTDLIAFPWTGDIAIDGTKAAKLLKKIFAEFPNASMRETVIRIIQDDGTAYMRGEYRPSSFGRATYADVFFESIKSKAATSPVKAEAPKLPAPAASGQPAAPPEVAAPVSHEPEAKYSVYQAGGRWLVQQGAKRGFGDHIHDTEAEARASAKQQSDIDKANAEFRAKQEAKAKAEADAQAAKDKPLNDYLDSLGIESMQRGKLSKVLSAGAARRSSTTGKDYTGTRFDVVRQMVADGYTAQSEEVDAIKELTGQQSNRMDNREQAEYEKRRKAAGKKTEYRLAAPNDGGFFVVTKIEHDLAKYFAPEPSVKPEPKAEAPSGESSAPPSKKERNRKKAADIKAKKVETPVQAVAKVAEEVRDVAKTEGQRDAAEVKKELIEKLEKAIEDAPSKDAENEWTALASRHAEAEAALMRASSNADHDQAKADGEAVLAEAKKLDPEGFANIQSPWQTSMDARLHRRGLPENVTIEIPGDGKFTLRGTKENLQEMLARVKRLPTKTKPDTKTKESGGLGMSAKQAVKWLNTENLRRFVINAINGDEWSQSIVQAYGNQGSAFEDDVKRIEKEVRDELSSAPPLSSPPSGSFITPAMDEAYLDAVKRGYMDSAAAMVEQAAKGAGYRLKALHGSPVASIADFKASDSGIAFTDNREVAKGYTMRRGLWRSPSPEGTVYDVVLKMENPLEIDADGARNNNIPYPGKEWKPTVFGNLPKDSMSVADAAKQAFADGYDGVIIRNVRDTADPTSKAKSTVMVVKSPSQIKSAETVTRDAEGNVIPLSARFNPDSPSILYSPPGDESDEAAFERLFEEAEGDELSDEVIALLDEFGYWTAANPKPAAPDDSTATLEGPPPPPRTSLKNAVVDQERIARGLQPIIGPIVRSWGEVGDAAAEVLAKDPQAGYALMHRLKDSPRALSDAESALLLLHKANVRHAVAKASHEVNTTPADSEENKQAKARYDRELEELNNIDMFSRAVGTEAGRSLAIRKLMRDEDFSTESLMQKYRTEVNLGQALTEEQTKIVSRYAEEIQKAQAELDRITEELNKKRAEEGLQKLTKELSKSVKKASPLKKTLLTKAQEARARLASIFSPKLSSPPSTLSSAPSGLTAENLADLALVGATYIEDGMTVLEKFAKALTKEFGDAIKPHADVIFERAKQAHAQAKAEAEASQKPEGVIAAAKTRLGDTPPGDLDKSLLVSLATAYIRQGVNVTEDIVTRITKDIQDIYPDATEANVRTVLSGYGKTSEPTKDEVLLKLSEVKAEARLLQSLEDVKGGSAPLRTGFQRGPKAQRQRELENDVRDAMRRAGIRTTGPEQLADARKAIVSRLTNQIEDLTAIIEGKSKPRPDKPVVNYDAEMNALVKERNELRDYVAELTGPSPELKWNRKAQAAAKASEEYYRRRIAANDLANKGATPQTESPETKAARAEAQKARDEFNALRESSGIPQVEALAKIEAAIAQEINKLASGAANPPKGVKPPPPAAIKAAKERLATLKKARALIQGKFQEGPRRIARTIAAIKRANAELQRRIDAKDIGPKAKGPPVPDTPELEALKDESAVLHKLLDDLREAAHPRRLPEEIALDNFRRHIIRRRNELDEKLKNGEYLEVPPVDPMFKQRRDAATYALRKAREEWTTELFNRKLEARPGWRKAVGALGEVVNTARAVLTSLDFSAVLRQGGFIALGNPIRAIKALPAMFKAFYSEASQHATHEEIKNRPNYALYQQSKLYLSDMDELDLSKMEEAFMSRWANKIPLVAGSQRAYVTFLNKLRADSFDAMVATLGRDGRVTRDEGRALANYVNVATGRGTIPLVGENKQANPVLSTIFFAPRLVASRLNLLLGQPIYGGSNRTRRLVAKEYAKFMVGFGVAIALAGLAKEDDDEEPFMVLDPRSSDFLKVRFKNTRIDFMAGIQQVTVFLARTLTGETVSSKGEAKATRNGLRPLEWLRDNRESAPDWMQEQISPNPLGDKKFNADSSLDILVRFARSKLSPVAGMAANLLTSEDYLGDPVTAKSEAFRMLVPMTFQSIGEVMEDQGVPRGTVLTLLSLLGAGVNSYDSSLTPERMLLNSTKSHPAIKTGSKPEDKREMNRMERQAFDRAVTESFSEKAKAVVEKYPGKDKAVIAKREKDLKDLLKKVRSTAVKTVTPRRTFEESRAAVSGPAVPASATRSTLRETLERLRATR